MRYYHTILPKALLSEASLKGKPRISLTKTYDRQQANPAGRSQQLSLQTAPKAKYSCIHGDNQQLKGTP